MYFDPTFILLIPAVFLALWAQTRVKSSFQHFSRVPSQQGYTADQVARAILDSEGLSDVAIRPIAGELTDNYDPRSRVLNLSQAVYGRNSIAAIGVAAHEAGHAIQHAHEYAPLRWRTALVPLAQIGSTLSWLILILGLILGMMGLARLGIWLFTAVVLFQLVTLPVEYNASNRALAALDSGGYLTREEVPMAKKVLSAAALTYVAAALMSVLQLMRMLFIARDR